MKIESFEKCKKQVDLFIILNGGKGEPIDNDTGSQKAITIMKYFFF